MAAGPGLCMLTLCVAVLFLLAAAEASEMPDLLDTSAGRARPPGAFILVLRMAAAVLATIWSAVLLKSARKACCNSDQIFDAVIKPGGPLCHCTYIVFFELLQILVFCIDRYNGGRILLSFYGALFTWYIDLSLAMSALSALWTLPWQKVATAAGSNSKCTSICLPLHAGAAVGVLGSATFVTVFMLFSEATNRLRGQTPYAS